MIDLRLLFSNYGEIILNNIIFWSFTVAIGGFLFGFDTAVISGADQPLQKLWNTSDIYHGAMIMSPALWGTVIGALAGGLLCEYFGRKKILMNVGILYLGSALGSALANTPEFFAIMRLIGGFGVGLSSIVVPAYISEISPAKQRGRLVALYQFQIVFGILIAFLSNYILQTYFSLNWRWMLGIEAVPAILFLLMIIKVPESPRWLILRKNDEKESRRILKIIDPENVDIVVNQIKNTGATMRDRLFKKSLSGPILMAFSIAVFNQLSGINFIIYFAPRVFSLADLNESIALLSTAGIGLVNLIFTLIGMFLIDNYGRRFLMKVGSVGYIFSLSAIAYAFLSKASGMIVVFFVFLFIASHAIGQGAVIWVFLAEIFPNNVRTKGQSIGSGTHWVLAALIALLMPYFLSRFEPHLIFSFFAFMMILQFLFVVFLMPETKKKSLETISDIFN